MSADATKESAESHVALCAMVVASVNAELGWNLGLEVQQRYSEELSRIAAPDTPAELLRRMAIAYHGDHQLVLSLSTRDHRDHDTAWAKWMPQCIAILRHAGLAWDGDGAAEIEDLAQVARFALARSLGNYRYQSRFSSWAYQVIVNSVRTELRSHKARKRAGQPDSLEQSDAQTLPIPEQDLPESIVAATELLALIQAVLQEQPDPRLNRIFYLWAIENQRIVDIGVQFNLSQGRIRSLLKHCLSLLQNDQRITHWIEELGVSEG